jgi:hypothetical protein
VSPRNFQTVLVHGVQITFPFFLENEYILPYFSKQDKMAGINLKINAFFNFLLIIFVYNRCDSIVRNFVTCTLHQLLLE